MFTLPVKQCVRCLICRANKEIKHCLTKSLKVKGQHKSCKLCPKTKPVPKVYKNRKY